MKADSLEQLKALRERMQRERAAHDAPAERALEPAAREAADDRLFADAVGPVRA
ncbi:MAG: DNA mismatch repair protein MutS, partial [Burkholderiaceae bacterium]